MTTRRTGSFSSGIGQRAEFIIVSRMLIVKPFHPENQFFGPLPLSRFNTRQEESNKEKKLFFFFSS